MTTIAELQTKLSMDAAQFFETTEKAQKQMSGFMQAMSEASKGIEHLLEFEALKDGAERLNEFIRSGAESAEQVQHLSERTGESVQQIQMLGYAAQVTGTQNETLLKGVDHLSKNMAEAAGGARAQADVFAAMGLKVTDANGRLRPLDETLGDIAERFKSYADGPAKAALAQELFGKSGADLIPLLNKGRDGLDELKVQAQQLGVVMSDELVKAAAEANEDFKRLDATSAALRTTIAAQMAPALDVLIQDMNSGAQSGGALRDVVDGIVWVFKAGATAGEALAGAVQSVGKWLGGTAAAVVNVLHGDLKGAAAAIDATSEDIDQILQDRIDSMANIWKKGGDELAAARQDAEKKASAPLVNKNADPLGGQFAIANAQAKSELALLRESIRERDALLDDSYKNGAVNVADYYSQRLDIERQGSSKEIDILRAQIAQAQALYRQAGKGQEQTSMQAKLIELNGQLALAEQKRINATLDGERSLADALAQQRSAMADIAASSQAALGKAALEGQASALEQAHALMRVSDTQYYEGLRAQEQKAYELETQLLQKRLQNFRGSNEQRKQLETETDGKLQLLEQQHQNKLTQIDQAAQRERLQYALQAADSIKSSAADALASYMEGSKSAKDAFKGFAQSVIHDLADMAARWLVNLAVQEVIGTAATTAGVAQAGTLAAAWAPAAAGVSIATFGAADAAGAAGLASTYALADSLSFLGARAAGGRVSAAGAFLVGERGPEMFVPDTAGHIVSNDELHGSGDVRITMHNYAGVDVETRRMSDGEIVQTIRNAHDSAVRTARGQVLRNLGDNASPETRQIARMHRTQPRPLS